MRSKYDDPQKVMEYVLMAHGQRLLDRSESEPFYVRVSEMARHFSPDDGQFLDVGCGVGRTTADIAIRLPASTVYGLDPSREMIKWARRLVIDGKTFVFQRHKYRGLGLKNVILEEGYLDGIINEFGHDSFDGISSVNVLDRVEDPPEMLDSMSLLLRPHGTLLVVNAFDYEDITPPDKRISKEQMDSRIRDLGFSLVITADTVLKKIIPGTEKEYYEWLAIYEKLD